MLTKHKHVQNEKNHWETISPYLFHGDKDDAIRQIDETVTKIWRCMISYIYFAQAMSYRVYEERQNERQQHYFEALTQSHLLCIDGIAMQIFDRCGGKRRWPTRPWTANMNGTDFMPYFLDQISAKRKVGVIILTVYDESIGKGQERWPIIQQKFSERFPHVEIILFDFVHYRDRGAHDIAWQIDAVLDSRRRDYDDIIIINGWWWPLQEIRSAEQSALWQKHHCIVMNQWATLDFISWFEQRVPQRVVRLRVGETLWRIFAQPRNLRKLISMFSIVRYRHFVIKTLAKRLITK